MFLVSRLNAPRRLWLAVWLPWIFVLGAAAGAMLPVRPRLAPPAPASASPAASGEQTSAWTRSGNVAARHPVDVLRTIDGDTFEARVHLWPGLDMTTRVRLRGIDAPELKAACAEEYRMAEAASNALRSLLDEGDVIIFNIGPDKYAGRVVADAATRKTASVSEALRAGGLVRAYTGGRRSGWCGSASR